MIDLHCHVLDGIDDGPAMPAGSLALARAAVASGTRTIVATPHVNSRYANDAPAIAGALERLRALLRDDGQPLALVAGAEVALSRVFEIEPDELSRLCVGDGGWLLLEPPFRASAPQLVPAIEMLQKRGHGVVLAHPERCPLFYRDIGLLEQLVRRGVLTSVTASSLTGAFGGAARAFAIELAEIGLLHNIASDAHDDADRPPQIAKHIERAGLAGLGEWLTEDVPGAILSGSAIPPRPRAAISPRTGRRGSLSRLRRRLLAQRS